MMEMYISSKIPTMDLGIGLVVPVIHLYLLKKVKYLTVYAKNLVYLESGDDYDIWRSLSFCHLG